MILIPSIELMDGKVVSLEGGRPEGKAVLADDPLQVAHQLLRQGALFFHLVDLDAVFGTGNNDPVFQKFAEYSMPFQVGGGLRSEERVEEIFSIGADRAVLGTLFLNNPDEAAKIVERFGRRVMAALDVEEGTAKVAGWREESAQNLQEAYEILKNSGVGSLMYTRIDRGEKLTEPNIEAIREVADATGLDIYANMGVRSKEQLKGLRESGIEGLVGAVVGHQFYADKLKPTGTFLER